MHYYLRKAVKLDFEHDFLIQSLLFPNNHGYNMICLQGSKSFLSQNWTWISDLICKFEYHWYPFDTQSCQMDLEINDISGNKVMLRPIIIGYSGTSDLGRYYFRDMHKCTVDKYGRSGIFTDFIISRPLMSNSLTIFLPTAMLLFISQMVTTFNKTYLEMVIEVNATLLLVLTT